MRGALNSLEVICCPGWLIIAWLFKENFDTKNLFFLQLLQRKQLKKSGLCICVCAGAAGGFINKNCGKDKAGGVEFNRGGCVGVDWLEAICVWCSGDGLKAVPPFFCSILLNNGAGGLATARGKRSGAC